MITSKQCLELFGPPEEESSVTLWWVPPVYTISVIPKKIYCNHLLIPPLEKAFNNVVTRGLAHELKTWDGCFNIRKKKAASSWSLHAWGLAIDINAAWNQFGKPATMSKALVKCFTDAGFEWGGNWSRPDGMHFQLKELPK